MLSRWGADEVFPPCWRQQMEGSFLREAGQQLRGCCFCSSAFTNVSSSLVLGECNMIVLNRWEYGIGRMKVSTFNSSSMTFLGLALVLAHHPLSQNRGWCVFVISQLFSHNLLYMQWCPHGASHMSLKLEQSQSICFVPYLQPKLQPH